MKQKNNIDSKIVSALEKLTQVQRILLWDVSKKEGISPIQIRFLIYLSQYPDKLRKISIIAREYDLTKATVSDAIRTLDEKGLLKKQMSKNDKRSYIINLTEKGKSLVKRIDGWEDTLVYHVSKFPPVEKEQVLLFLMELIKSLYDDGIVTIARMCIACKNFKKGVKGFKTHYCMLTDRALLDTDLSIGCHKYQEKDTG